MNIAWGGADFDIAVAEWVQDKFEELREFGQFVPYRAIAILDDDGSPVGGIVMTHYKGFDAELSIYAPGVKWTRDALYDLFTWCFSHLGLERLTVKVSVKNKHSRRFVERLGFKVEGVIRRGYAGKHNLVHYGMLKDECRWLRTEA